MPDSVALIGNCQLAGIVDCLRLLSPKTKFDCFSLPALKTNRLRLDAVGSLKKYDLIISHVLTHQRYGPFSQERLTQRFPNVVFFPQIIFGGFHPDDSTLPYEGRSLGSPAGGRHSLLLAAAFALGIPPERAARLFNAYIFARLGYFEEYDLAKSVLLSFASKLGYDLSTSIDEWRKAGPFMHLPVHPSIRVLADIAARVAKKAGIPIEGSAENAPDRLMRGVIAPVYPVLAKRLGLGGSTSFKLSERGGADPDTHMSLEEFARQVYRIYADYPRESFDSPRFKKVRSILREECV